MFRRHIKPSTRELISMRGTFRRLASAIHSACDPRWPWAVSDGHRAARITRELVRQARMYEKLKQENR